MNINSLYKKKCLGWNALGPMLMTATINEFCQGGTGKLQTVFQGYYESCNITVLNHTTFYPIKHADREVLFQSNKDQFWSILFKKTFSVHFYGSNTSGR